MLRINILIILKGFFFFLSQVVWEALKNIHILFFFSFLLQNTSESHSCARSLLLADRMQIVVILSEFFNSTWHKANCASK